MILLGWLGWSQRRLARICLITQDQDSHSLVGVVIDFLEPHIHALQGLCIRGIIDQYNPDGISIVSPRDPVMVQKDSCLAWIALILPYPTSASSFFQIDAYKYLFNELIQHQIAKNHI